MRGKILAFGIAVLALSCNSNNQKINTNKIIETVNKDSFHQEVNGKQVSLYTLKNKNGITVQITNYGARIVSVLTPDKNGDFVDITLGYTTLKEYLHDSMYLGGIVGRFANRIAEGKFSLNGQDYTLSLNDGPNSLHGGNKGIDRRVWDAKQEGNKLWLEYLSQDMEEGYPGNLKIRVLYELTEDNKLSIKYEAETDKATVVNLTNHAYFNLSGEGSETILDHVMQINGNSITPVDETLIPKGTLSIVEGTPFDFRKPKTIGKDINAENEQLKYGQGYDHNWVLSKEDGKLALALSVKEPVSGRVLELYTTEPGVQFYSGNFMDGTVKGKSGSLYKYRAGIAIEPQHFPDSPNHPSFPNTVLLPGETYKQTSVFSFSVEE